MFFLIALGNHHRVSTESMFTAMWNAFQNCRFVPSQQGVVYYVSNWREVLQKEPPKVKSA